MVTQTVVISSYIPDDDMNTYKAEYMSHETRRVETVEQEFEGSVENIAYDYFGVYGDDLVRLTDESGTVVYEAAIEDDCCA